MTELKLRDDKICTSVLYDCWRLVLYVCHSNQTLLLYIYDSIGTCALSVGFARNCCQVWVFN